MMHFIPEISAGSSECCEVCPPKRFRADKGGGIPLISPDFTYGRLQMKKSRRLACHNKPLMVMTIPSGVITFHVGIRKLADEVSRRRTVL